jgi:hypothetical protein
MNRARVFAMMVIVAGIISAACDSFVDYTLVNETGGPLVTWATTDDCSLEITRQEHYFGEEAVGPGETIAYVEIFGPGPQAKCVQAVDQERRLVFAGAYEAGRTYVVGQDAPVGPRVPSREDLKSHGTVNEVLEWFETAPVGFVLFWGMDLAFLAALLLLALMGAQHAWRFANRVLRRQA